MMPPPGYYPDPQRPGLQRWWDGAQWVGQPVASPQTGPAQTPQQPLYGTSASASGTPLTGYTPPYGSTSYGTPYGNVPPGNAQPGNPYGPPQPGAWYPPTQTWGGPTPGGYYYAQPKKRGKRWWTVFAVIAVAVLALVGVGVFFVVRVAIDDVLAPRNVASHYLGDLRDGNYDDAYSRLCAQDQASISPARFDRAFTAVHPTSFHITGTSFHEDDSSKIATVVFDETASDGSSGSQSLRLIHEDGDWRICHFGAAPSTWTGGSPTTGGTPGLPAAFRTDATLVGQSH